MTTSLKSLYMKTYGCQMNVYDSQRMEEMLRPLGYQLSPTPRRADLIIFNTCHIRAKAEDKLFSDLGRFHPLKKEKEAEGSAMILVVAGCVGQALGKRIIQKAPYVDVVVGPQTYQTLPETIARILRERDPNPGKGKGAVAVGFPTISKFDLLPQERTANGPTAFLSIQEGCDKFCRYCVVPYTRGAEYSRPVQEVLDEAKRLLDQGVKDITLLGQNVNAYHGIGPEGASWGLGRLMRALAEFEGMERIRYTTSHPRDMDAELIEVHGTVPAVMPYLHLPVQSGSDKILAHMNRKYTVDSYLDIIERLRKARPDMAFSSDFIVGYPGETEEDFDATCALVQKVGFAQAYSFMFSPRPGTPAATYAQIDEAVKKARLAQLQEILTQSQQHFNQTMVGKTLDVLVEKPGRHAHQWIGRSVYMQSVYFSHPCSPVGQMLPITITDSSTNSLSGVYYAA